MFGSSLTSGTANAFASSSSLGYPVPRIPNPPKVGWPVPSQENYPKSQRLRRIVDLPIPQINQHPSEEPIQLSP
jgi:hypothetical protein